MMRGHILIIDDEASVRDAFTLALESEYSTETAPNGEHGVARASARKPDLIFLDLRMPEVDGVQTLRRLQNCCADVPTYICTAFRRDYMKELELAVSDGLAFQVVDKPLTAEQIRAIARAVLGGPEAVE